MFGNLFGSEPNWLSSIIAKAGSNVFRLCKIFCVPIVFNSAAEYVEADPVKLSFLRVKIPVTTTSSNFTSSSRNTIESSFRTSPAFNFRIFTLSVFIPIKETTNVAESAGINTLNLPSTSVAVPTDVPSHRTVTPGKGTFFSSVTFPSTCLLSNRVESLVPAFTNTGNPSNKTINNRITTITAILRDSNFRLKTFLS